MAKTPLQPLIVASTDSLGVEPYFIETASLDARLLVAIGNVQGQVPHGCGSIIARRASNFAIRMTRYPPHFPGEAAESRWPGAVGPGGSFPSRACQCAGAHAAHWQAPCFQVATTLPASQLRPPQARRAQAADVTVPLSGHHGRSCSRADSASDSRIWLGQCGGPGRRAQLEYEAFKLGSIMMRIRQGQVTGSNIRVAKTSFLLSRGREEFSTLSRIGFG